MFKCRQYPKLGAKGVVNLALSVLNTECAFSFYDTYNDQVHVDTYIVVGISSSFHTYSYVL